MKRDFPQSNFKMASVCDLFSPFLLISFLLFSSLLCSTVLGDTSTAGSAGSGEEYRAILHQMEAEIESLRFQVETLSTQLNKSIKVNERQTKKIASLQKLLEKVTVNVTRTSSLSPPLASPSSMMEEINVRSSSILESLPISSSVIEAMPTILLTTPTSILVTPTATPTNSLTASTQNINDNDNDDSIASNSNTLMGVIIAIITILIVGSILYIAYQYRYQVSGVVYMGMVFSKIIVNVYLVFWQLIYQSCMYIYVYIMNGN